MYNELIKQLREDKSWIEQGTTKTEHEIAEHIQQAADVIEKLSARVDSLQIFVDNISKLPDCNTCWKKNMCEFMPKYGEYCRINCHAWLGEPEPSEEEATDAPQD